MFIGSDVWWCYSHLSLFQHGRSEISTCIQVSIQRKTTMANKRRTFTRTQLSTLGTDLGSVVGLDLNNFNSFNLGFVLNEVLKLMKTPIANPIVHSSAPGNLPYSLEVFHYDFVSSETGNNFLADIVVNPTYEPVFPSRDFFKQSLCRPCAFALKFTSQEFEFSFSLFHFGGFEKLFIGSNSKIIHSQVHAQNLMRIRVSGRKFLGECEKEKASIFFINNQKTFSNLPTKILFIKIRNFERNLDSSLNGRNSQNIIFERSRTGKIISNGRTLNYWVGFCIFNNSTRLLDTSNSNLGWQSFSQFRINKRMQLNIISNLHSPSDINTILKPLFIQFKSINNLLSWLNFNFSSNSDSHGKLKNSNYLNISEIAIPPKPKGMGILAEFI
jgi:hypothetical protein